MYRSTESEATTPTVLRDFIDRLGLNLGAIRLLQAETPILEAHIALNAAIGGVDPGETLVVPGHSFYAQITRPLSGGTPQIQLTPEPTSEHGLTYLSRQTVIVPELILPDTPQEPAKAPRPAPQLPERLVHNVWAGVAIGFAVGFPINPSSHTMTALVTALCIASAAVLLRWYDHIKLRRLLRKDEAA